MPCNSSRLLVVSHAVYPRNRAFILTKKAWRRAASLLISLTMVATLAMAMSTDAYTRPAANGLQVTDYEIAADPGTFEKNGDYVKFTISFTMPNDLDGSEAVGIVASGVGLRYIASTDTTVKIGTGAAVQKPSVLNPSITLEGADFQSAKGQKVVITFRFNVEGQAENR